MGFKLESTPPESLSIWPENMHAFKVFYRQRTQWNVGMGGVIGLRNESLEFAFKIEGVPKAEWASVMDAVQTMESETLRLWREKSP